MGKIFCPLIREACHGEGCVLWRNETCLLASFVEVISSPEEEIEAEKEIPSEIEMKTLEQLAVELATFVKRQFPEAENMRGSLYRAKNVFWASKGLPETFGLPPEIRLKVEKAEMLAEQKLGEEQTIKERTQIEKEKQSLPPLINECVEWAKRFDLRRVTKSDIGAFLAEKNVELTTHSTNLLYAKANLLLKSK